MVRLRVKEILEEKDKSIYWLWKTYFPIMSYTSLNNIIKNKHRVISFDLLNNLCRALKVDINELLERIPDEDEKRK